MTPKVTCEDIAVILGVSESWVNRALHNAIEKMRKEAERLNIRDIEDIFGE